MNIPYETMSWESTDRMARIRSLQSEFICGARVLYPTSSVIGGYVVMVYPAKELDAGDYIVELANGEWVASLAATEPSITTKIGEAGVSFAHSSEPPPGFEAH